MKLLVYFFVVFYSLNSFADYKSRKPDTYKIPPPPIKDSIEEQNDFKILHEWEQTRTKQQCDFAKEAVYASFETYWEVLLNKYTDEQNQTQVFTKKQISEFKSSIKDVMNYTDKVTKFFKSKYRRLRPYDRDTTLSPCALRPGGRASYPSSHTSKAFASACVLASMYPQHQDVLMDYAEFMAELRVLGGVHHPSDIDAGREIGLQVCAEVLKSN